MHAYKIGKSNWSSNSRHRTIKKEDKFCELIEERLAVDENFVKNIIFCNEETSTAVDLSINKTAGFEGMKIHE